MFELEPEVAKRITEPAPVEGVHATPDGGATARPPAMHDAASLLHLQRTAGNGAVVQLLSDESGEEQDAAPRSPVHDVIGSGGGAPLDKATRSTMEAGFGEDFGDVRVHTDERASASAASVGANAYTVGSDIVFRSGHLDAGSPTGQRTIAHELSHVVQQRSGPVDGTDAPGGIRLSDPSDRFERAADATADEVMSGSSAPAAATDAAAPSLQLEAEEEQEVPVQRQEAMEEDDEEAEAG